MPDVSEKNLLDYVDVKCFDKFELGSDVVKYKINNKCDDLFVWKKIKKYINTSFHEYSRTSSKRDT